jgi:putative modified peptide
VRGERVRSDPLVRAERAEQLALGRVDLDFLAPMRRQRQPAAFAAQAIATGQQHVQIETDFLARLQIQHRAATHLHGRLPLPIASTLPKIGPPILPSFGRFGCESARRAALGGVGMTNKALTAPWDPQLAARLRELLSSDDDFRTQFQADALAALRTLGYTSPEPGKMTACGLLPAAQLEPFADCKVQELASKEVIAAARQEVMAMLTRGLDQSTPRLDAALGNARYIRK